MSNEGKRISAKRKFSLSNYAAESAVTALPHMFRPQSLSLQLDGFTKRKKLFQSIIRGIITKISFN